MDAAKRGPSGRARRGKGVLAGIGVAAILKSMEKRAVDEDEPWVLVKSPEVDKLVAVAAQLIRDDRPDDEAVHRLVEAAGGHRDDLKRAAAHVRFGGSVKFDRGSDRANRLLLAAFSGQPVQQVTTDQDELFARVDALMSVPVEEAWPTLVALRPGLADLEPRFAPRPISESERDRVWDELIAALAPLVGPSAQSDDPLVQSEPAWNVSRLFLAVRVGLLDGVDYSGE